MKTTTKYVGLDVHKDATVGAVAEAGRTGEVRLHGTISSDLGALEKLRRKLGGEGITLHLVHEAGPTGNHSLRAQFRHSTLHGAGPRVHPHLLRRSCATEMIRCGANIWAVKELLGHEDLESIEYYALLDINDLKKTHASCHPRDRVQTVDAAPHKAAD